MWLGVWPAHVQKLVPAVVIFGVATLFSVLAVSLHFAAAIKKAGARAFDLKYCQPPDTTDPSPMPTVRTLLLLCNNDVREIDAEMAFGGGSGVYHRRETTVTSSSGYPCRAR